MIRNLLQPTGLLDRTLSSPTKHFGAILFLVCLLAWSVSAAGACPVCVSMPSKTAADRLIEAEVVLFAREHPEHRFSYRALKVLKGGLKNSHIDVFIDSATRRQLKVHPEQVVVLLRESPSTDWVSLGIADRAYQAVVRRVLAQAVDWNGAKGRIRRCNYFLSLFGHSNQAIFELAYLELGRAPYPLIQRATCSVAKQRLYGILRKREYLTWRPLAILMLSQQADPIDRAWIEKSFHDCGRFGLSTNLAALTTAFIELNGAQALPIIERRYLGNPARTETELRAVIAALSVHGSEGHVHLRERIVTGYATALRCHPELAGMIAMDLTAWEDWGHREALRIIRKKPDWEFSRLESAAIDRYILPTDH